jgi:glucosamine--fructose-6-phosphate aminotransferase (isomerizing)
VIKTAETLTMTAVRLPPNADEVLRTMRRQPDDVRRLLADGWKQTRQAVDLLDGAERVILTGVGSSYNAALVGAWMFREIGLDARAVAASDIWLYPQNNRFRPTDAVIVLSHFGLRSAALETLNLARAAGATVLSVGSLTVDHPGSRLILRTVERETSMISTASHLAAMMVLSQIALVLGERMRRSAVAGWRETIDALPNMLEQMLKRDEEVIPVARIAADRHVYAVAAGPNESTATEFMMKARQAGNASVDAFPFEQLIHGPIVAADTGDLGVVIRLPGPSADRSAEFARVMDRIGMRLWVVGQSASDVHPVAVFDVPDVPEMLSPLITLIPMQMLAYQVALIRQMNPDTFDRLLPLLP